MPYVIAALVIVGVMSALNLVLTFAVIRRVRHAEQHAAPSGPPLLPVGSTVPDVSGIGRPSVIGFFDTECQACPGQLPPFLQLVADAGYSPAQVLAVVSGPDGESYADALRGSATVIAEPANGPVCLAFPNSAFPAFYLLDDSGRVRSRAVTVAGLGTPVTA
ncbi:TlpA family protein disulfide reductase [Nonomuraea sp. NPDC001831]|uniref:TlpA family protein disulfide reductase n=1 Tax=Nonomuraea sp. NPDC001831 TaxID=3364340 RepID=UPI00367D222F